MEAGEVLYVGCGVCLSALNGVGHFSSVIDRLLVELESLKLKL